MFEWATSCGGLDGRSGALLGRVGAWLGGLLALGILACSSPDPIDPGLEFGKGPRASVDPSSEEAPLGAGPGGPMNSMGAGTSRGAGTSMGPGGTGGPGTGIPAHLHLDGIGPAGEPLPYPPSADRPDFPTLPDSRSLPRNGVISDRFTAEGQRVVYPFEAEAGEYSIFDLRSFGYERGWWSRSRLEVIDTGGRVLAKVERSGPTVHRSWLPFRAPGEGRYRLVLSSVEREFRYLLLRHSNYPERMDGEAQSVGDRERVHGYLNGTSDRALFHLHLALGDEVLLRALPAEEQMRRSLREPKESREDPGFPHYVIEPLEAGGAGRATGSRWIRAEATGVYPFVVRIDDARRSTGGGRGGVPEPVAGGLFELFINRSPRAHSIEGLVVDRADDPIAGLALTFRQEPDGVLYGEAITDFEGNYRIGLADGVYSVRMEDAQGRRQNFRTKIDGPRRLDALFDPESVVPFGPRRSR